MDWVKTRSTLLAFCGIAFGIYWMVTADLRPMTSELPEANLSPRSKMLDQIRREASSLSVRELLGLKKKALSKDLSEAERLQSIYTISLSSKAVSRTFLREIARSQVPQPVRAAAREALRHSDKKFPPY